MAVLNNLQQRVEYLDVSQSQSIVQLYRRESNSALRMAKLKVRIREQGSCPIKSGYY